MRSLPTFPHEINLTHKSIYLSKYYYEYTNEGNRHSKLQDKMKTQSAEKNHLH